MADLKKLISLAALIFEDQEPPTQKALSDFVNAQAKWLDMQTNAIPFTECELDEAVKTLETRFSTRMPLGSIFQSEDCKPWLADRQGDIKWYYWDRYRQHLLTSKGFPLHVVRSLNTVTDKIIDHLADPTTVGPWSRKGLVVGHVQSGKTANYTGLVCKAADAGYKVIIILAGMLKSLRNQTQERIDSDFMGWCTLSRKYIGAATFGSERKPVCFTTTMQDFEKKVANAMAVGLQALNEPVVLVIKKNKSTLENLYNWLYDHNPHNLRDFPMLLVDDEADHASINTNRKEDSPTAINIAIRNLLSIFERSSFVGYTATPFANIFIDPDTDDEMENEDLFPRHFILSLDPPDNYVGANRIFTKAADLDIIRDINDNDALLPVKHKINLIPVAVPASLHKAIDCFIIARALRILRGQQGKHHSMMINASRFTAVQNHLKNLVDDLIKERRDAVNNFSGLSYAEALKNSSLAAIHETWKNEYAKAGFEWTDVQAVLKKSIDPIKVISVNIGSTDMLDYSKSKYPDGRSVIAVGGLSLSRGLTLEGLLVSYFLRNSIMYDTLMQMGRWFGYRDGYEDLCRIFMTPDASSWYAHIAEVTEELRSDFKAMETASLTPLEFGLRVRSHPAALIVTARNRMRTGRSVPHKIALEGRLIETIVLSSDQTVIDANLNLVKRVLQESDTESKAKRTNLGYVWENVSVKQIKTFVEHFKNHPHSFYTHYYEPLVDHLSWLENEGIRNGDILLKTLKQQDDDDDLPIFGLKGRMQTRTSNTADVGNGMISFKKKARIGESRDEEVGIDAITLENLRRREGSKTINPKHYREVVGKRPLLIIHLLNLPDAGISGVVAYGLSLPGSATTKKPKKLVEYIVTTTYWNQHYAESLEEEEIE